MNSTMKRVQAAGGIVLNQYNELLMICRWLKWDLPKGHVERKESMEHCALREVEEETGLHDLRIVSYIGATEHVHFDKTVKSEIIKEVHWYEMRADKQEELHPQYDEGIDWILWVPKKEVENYLRNSYENIRIILRKCSLFAHSA